MGLPRCCFARTQTWLQAGKYLNALVSDLPSRNGWSVAEYAGDRSPGKSQRLLNRASWDERAAVSLVRRYAAAGLDEAAPRSRRRRMAVGALDETGLAIDVLTDAYGDGLSFDFVCGDEVCGSCTALREFLEGQGQVYVLPVASSFTLTLAGITLTCAEAVRKLLKGKKAWEVRSAGQGSKGERWYAWAWLATASPRHSLLVRRHLKTGELAFHYCFAPDGQPASKARLAPG